jgi:thymidylate synthase
MNNIDKQYTALLQDILDNGVEKKDRTGTGTISVFGRQIRHKMSEGFPLLTTKKMPFKTITTELLWFLRGDTNIKFLVDNDCHIWDGDAYKNYVKWWEESDDSCNLTEEQSSKWLKLIDGGLQWAPFSQEEFINKIKTDDEFAKKWGELGPIYGKQWRDWLNLKWEATDKADPSHPDRPMLKWKLEGIDQITNLINDLKTNPDSRRLLVSAWNVSDLPNQVLPPCHYGFQVYTRELSLEERHQLALPIWKEKYGPLADMMVLTNVDNTPYKIPTRAISLMWNQRSVDTFLGLPFNIASYGLLLEIIAKEVNMVPDELIGNLGDVHLYSNHVEQAKEQIGRDLTYDERTEMLKEAMGIENYKNAIKELMPFGGGMSEYYEAYKIPNRTREPFPLPKLVINENNKMRVGGSIFTYMNTDFTLENYQSHPSIKAPLSN